MQLDYTHQPGLKKNKRNITEDIQPLISIVTPYYNAWKYFEQTYNCVINQTFPHFEWIIVDDGSTEDVGKLKMLVDSDTRIRIVEQRNSGQAHARNHGINLAKTEIIIPLDADDLIEPTYLEVTYWGLKKNPDAGWCYTDSVGFQEQEYIWSKSFSADRLKYNNFLVCTAAIRKEALVEIGGYDESNSHYDEDWKLWLDLLSTGRFPVHLNIIGFWYRRTSSGMGSQVRADKVLRDRSDAMIKKSAEKVDTTIKAKEYPIAGLTNRFLQPVCSEWEQADPYEASSKNILMILPWMEMGGADLFNLDVVKKLDKKLFGISIVTTVKSPNTWRQKFEQYADQIFTLPDFLEITDYPEFISYLIKTRKIDIVFLSNSYYGYYLLPWIKSCFSDITIVDYVHMEEWYWRRGGYSRISGVFGAFIDKTFVCNDKSSRILVDKFGRNADTVETLYIGVDSDKYSSEKIEYGIVRKQYAIPTDTPMVLFPCRIHPQKRPFLMVQIAKELVRRNVKICFMVVGDGPQLAEVQAETEKYELNQTIYFAGRQDNMLPFYRDSTLTLICSLKEGLALTAYESLAMETPVVTSDVGGQSELIHSSVGCVVPLMQNESESLDNREFGQEEINLYADAILSIIEDQKAYKQMCLECRKRILDYFSTDKMIDRLQSELIAISTVPNKVSYGKFDMIPADFLMEFCTLYTEYELLEDYAKNVNHPLDTKNELIRIANSKWGNRMIRLAFKLKLNKLFH